VSDNNQREVSTSSMKAEAQNLQENLLQADGLQSEDLKSEDEWSVRAQTGSGPDSGPKEESVPPVSDGASSVPAAPSADADDVGGEKTSTSAAADAGADAGTNEEKTETGRKRSGARPNAPVEISPQPLHERQLPFKQGDLIDGIVVRVDADGAVIDLGLWVEGYIPVREMSPLGNVSPDQVMTVGEKIQSQVTSLTGPDGLVRLSSARVELEEGWKNIERAMEANGGIVTGVVTEAVKGGLRLDVGVEGFLPASLVDLRPVQDLTPFAGRELTCKVIELDHRRFKVVLSRRAVLEEDRKKQRAEVFGRLSVGEVYEGTVSSVTDIGAFVDLGGADGLVHVTELSWGRVKNPKGFIKPGTEVKVKVLEIDRERDRISLSMKATQENPWDEFVRKHRVGEIIAGKIVKLVDFGVFVEVAHGVEGLVHISELAPQRIEHPSEVVSAGDETRVRIIEIDAARRRLSLSLRAVEDQEFSRRASGGGKPARKGGGRGGRHSGKQSFGSSPQGGLRGSIGSDSFAALEALKTQLSEEQS